MVNNSSLFTDSTKGKARKKTCQGTGRGTKWGTKPQGKAGKKQLQRYKKRPRGQGN